METILEVKDLTKVFGKDNPFVAVDHISFELPKGQVLGIIGESGSGKSTTVNLIARLMDATCGSIILDGQDITGVKGANLRQVYKDIQMVFQNAVDSFDPRRTLGYGIGESLINHGICRAEAKKEAVRLLELCGLSSDFADRYPHEVSGGQCQRAAIARALAIKPKLLICDEATSALDVTIQREILDLLIGLRKTFGEELSILFICHDIALVQEFCDQVIVMYKGTIVEKGSPSEVIEHPQDEYTQRLIDSVM